MIFSMDFFFRFWKIPQIFYFFFDLKKKFFFGEFRRLDLNLWIEGYVIVRENQAAAMKLQTPSVADNFAIRPQKFRKFPENSRHWDDRSQISFSGFRNNYV